ncbi:MAG: thermophilic metalloprotease (M29) superfamily [Candidatus Doudnabacteria bacterium RIFCSPLOWO2_02_FULL_49_13]|uniref:Thermophilic metalloprotease (M29) superfamily n=1 Tax=Candidatus Doudnabacteria bacterium RIFCSPHIGHO2_12_FULL_48_16 TaxID=1817838 RepID=A0A1F5PK21_9BACT|nr:MAG: thermophilic metalloprotease (M29) superfamily [Candidatus Doudnabacteria bacterium RIFCSPHIGHO2_02_FULL_49_24]OGE88535.1 MAG: thermophilic metalloprotease (M29) superfamily [Candidatus Doudnabacteria bacterium RIFCSPHIGHO2_01_FULL_50_67]OGE90283.1 MAG: thermophilic metalloprotease (M29) superfamily [Candidatus Doudnabacteria bacterium RIFCSPHIGHO2_12_FULL_48_16]OGE96939.1 MAG: thermophilic metalloprotease (M29) superfamily [Candidatus Doudnabacteria bacterium RIFCSPLOWO2_01_FULL_49_40]
MFTFHPDQKILNRYAQVLVRFALGGGKGIKRGEVVRVSANESARPLFLAVCNAVVDAGGHVISHYAPDDEQGDKRRNESYTRYFYEQAEQHQLDFFPDKYLKGLMNQMDHSIFLLSTNDPHALRGVDPKKIMRRGVALKPFMDWRNEKEWAGKFTWTIALYGTAAMAAEAGLSEKAYWNQIIKACFLDHPNPVAKWKQIYRELEKYRTKLNKLAPQTESLHAVGPDMDLWVKLGEKRQWLGGSGRNIPSFELFTSPDWRGTEGWIRFNQPLYRYSNKITGIQLWFKNGRVVKSSAKSNEKLLKQMIATPGADRIGEYSLTDRRFSRITKFMAETLFDENMGGPQGNTHLALGMSYRDTYAGDAAKLTKKQALALGFNDSSVHTDIISTTPRVVTAHLKNGSRKIIYANGQFVL